MLHLTANNFEAEIYNSESPIILMLYANWCNKCSMMKPVFADMEKKYRSQINFYLADIETPSLPKKFETEIVPTFLFLKNGQIEATFSGIIDTNVFDTRIQKIFRNC